MGDDGSGFVEHSHAALEFGDHGVVAANVDGSGHPQVSLEDFDEIPVEVPMFDAVVVAVADKEQRLFTTRIERDAVAGFEKARRWARSAERLHKFAVFVEFEDAV